MACISYHLNLCSQVTPPQESGSIDITIEASNDITNISDTFTLNLGC